MERAGQVPQVVPWAARRPPVPDVLALDVPVEPEEAAGVVMAVGPVMEAHGAAAADRVAVAGKAVVVDKVVAAGKAGSVMKGYARSAHSMWPGPSCCLRKMGSA